MPRVARIVSPAPLHHVTQRRNNRQGVLFLDDDHRVRLEPLCELAEGNRAEIHAYCLTTNHVHLAATPTSERALAATPPGLYECSK